MLWHCRILPLAAGILLGDRAEASELAEPPSDFAGPLVLQAAGAIHSLGLGIREELQLRLLPLERWV